MTDDEAFATIAHAATQWQRDQGVTGPSVASMLQGVDVSKAAGGIYTLTPSNPPRLRTPHLRNFVKRVWHFMRTGQWVRSNRFAGWQNDALEPAPCLFHPQPCVVITRKEALERWPMPDDEGDFLSDQIVDIPPDETPIIRKPKP